MEYHNRTDFRVFDALVRAIDTASKTEIQNALDTAVEQSQALHKPASQRAIWKRFAVLLRAQLREF